MTYEEKIEIERKKGFAETLKSWKNEEWILPELIDFKPKTQEFNNISIPNDNLSTGPLTLKLPKRKYNSLYFSAIGELSRKKLEQRILMDERTTLREPGNKDEQKAKDIVKNNKDSWELTLKRTNKDTNLNNLLKNLESKDSSQGIKTLSFISS